MIKVLFFGPVANRVGARQIELPHVEGMRWQNVRDELQLGYPEAFSLVLIVAVNAQRVRNDEGVALADGAEIVFMLRNSGECHERRPLDTGLLNCQ